MGTTAELTYGDFLAGHWAGRVGEASGVGEANGEGDAGGSGALGGPEAADGQVAAVSGKIGQARAFVFGTSIFFRTHPRGGLSQAATAIHWAAG